MKVCKFGGSSLADSGQIRKVAEIIKSDTSRRVIVVSAPGKRNNEDVKITDLLYLCAGKAELNEPFDEPFNVIRERFNGICTDLGIGELEVDLGEIEKNIKKGLGSHYAASRGEYLSAKVLSSFLKAEFIDAEDVIRITEDGRVDPISYGLLKKRISSDRLYVLPGFFGTNSKGEIRTFSRGGSDISGAIAARAAGADVYENWTDVSGLKMADPRRFDSPPVIREITYREIRELACVGANVFHEEAITPVKDREIPVNIRNTNDPGDPGTMIKALRDPVKNPLAGVSGKNGYTVLWAGKLMMKRYNSFIPNLQARLNELDMFPEFIFLGSDSVVFFIDKRKTVNRLEILIRELSNCNPAPDGIRVDGSAGIIGVVGEGLSSKKRVAADVFTALAREDINVGYTSFGGSDVSLLIGVSMEDYEAALIAVYKSLIPSINKAAISPSI